MSLRTLLPVLFVVSVCGSGSTWAQPQEEQLPEPEELGVSVVDGEGYTVHRLVVPGPIEEWVVGSDASDSPIVAIASRRDAADDSPLNVQIWRFPDPLGLQPVDLDPLDEIDALEILEPEASHDEEAVILVFGESRMQIVSLDGRRKRIVTMPSGFVSIERSRWIDRQAGRPSTAVFQSMGMVEKLRLQEDWGAVDREWSVETPLMIDRVWGGLELESPDVVEFAVSDSGESLYLIGPEPNGLYRLRSIALESALGAEPTQSEFWSRFSGPETILESWYVIFNQRPALIVTSVQADQHGVFERKKIRLFVLDRDRSRSGSPPILEAVTRSRNWYRTCAGIADVDGDGFDDVVSGQPQGLGAGKLWVTAYLSRSARSFQPKPVGTMLQISDGERCSFGADFDLDGRPDLLVVDGDAVAVFGLVEPDKKGNIVSDTPSWLIDLEDIRGTPRLVWIFDEQRPRIVARGKSEAGQGRLSLIRIGESN